MISDPYRGVDNNRPPLRGVRLFLLKAGDSENLGVRLVFSKNLPKSWGAVIFILGGTQLNFVAKT